MARKHNHKYYFGLEIAGTKIWACALPECNHYMPKHMENMVNGKKAICWKCGETAIVNFTLMKEYPQGKVLCDECITLKNYNQMPKSEEIMTASSELGLCTRCNEHERLATNPNGLCLQCIMIDLGVKM